MGNIEQLHHNVLRARALWLVGVCGGELPREAWAEALHCLVVHLSANDLVVSLSAVSALMAMASAIFEEVQVSAVGLPQGSSHIHTGDTKAETCVMLSQGNCTWTSADIQLCFGSFTCCH